MPELFSETTIDPEKNYLEDLVGEGKKFASPEELARGKAESDAFIARLQQEAAEMRDELKARKTMEQVLDQLNHTPTPQSPTPATTPNAALETTTENVDVESLVQDEVQKHLTKMQQENAAQSNLERVQSALRNVFGNGYNTILKEKTESLGLSEQFATELAKTQPDAFLQLVGARQTSETQTVQSLRTPERTPSNTKNYSYYQTIRKEDPDRYFSPALQNEMFAAASEQGEDFYQP